MKTETLLLLAAVGVALYFLFEIPSSSAAPASTTATVPVQTIAPPATPVVQLPGYYLGGPPQVTQSIPSPATWPTAVGTAIQGSFPPHGIASSVILAGRPGIAGYRRRA